MALLFVKVVLHGAFKGSPPLALGVLVSISSFRIHGDQKL